MAKIYIIAGEASGDRLGADLMRALGLMSPDVEFVGIGGAEMTAAGLTSLYPMEELSVMGLVEVIKHYPRLKRRLNETVQDIIDHRPDVVLTIDSPDFCLRVARQVKEKLGVKTIHYVSPSIWAWRPKRAEKLKGVIDHVMTLLPFEPAYLHKEGIAATHVGHPLAHTPIYSDAQIEATLARYDLRSAPLLFLPGSRRSEVMRLLPHFLQVDAHFAKAGLCTALISTPAMAPVIREECRKAGASIAIIDHATRMEKEQLFQSAQAALAASGTVTLELAAARTPMVVAYDMSWLTMRIMRYMALIDTVTLVNIITQTRIVPEFLGPQCRAQNIIPALDALLSDPQYMDAALDQTMQALGRDDSPPPQRAAHMVLDVLRS